jgi:hypothetical protein
MDVQTKDVDDAFVDDMKELQKVRHQQPKCKKGNLILGLVVQELRSTDQRTVQRGHLVRGIGKCMAYLALQQSLDLCLNALNLPQ